jgi:PKD repeat protein
MVLLVASCTSTISPDATPQVSASESSIKDTVETTLPESEAIAEDPTEEPSPTPILTETVVPTATSSPISSPVASFSASTDEGPAGLTVTFTSTSDGQIDSWNWTFSDGRTASGKSVEWVFTGSGVQLVTLEVKGEGGSDSVSAPAVTVHPGPVVSIAHSPLRLDLVVGLSSTVEILAWDGFGNLIEDPDLSWLNWEAESVAGSITSPGNFTAGTVAGEYQDGIRVTGSFTDIVHSIEIPVTLRPGDLASVNVSPQVIELVVGSTANVEITTVDKYGNTVPATIRGHNLPDGTSFDGIATITGGTTAGSLTDEILATASAGPVEIEVVANITLTPDAFSKIDFGDLPGYSEPEKQVDVVAIATDQFGNPVADVPVSLAYDQAVSSNPTGFIAPDDETIVTVSATASSGATNVSQEQKIYVGTPGTLFVIPTFGGRPVSELGVELSSVSAFPQKEGGAQLISQDWRQDLGAVVLSGLDLETSYVIYGGIDSETGIFAGLDGRVVGEGKTTTLFDHQPVNGIEVPVVWEVYLNSPKSTADGLGDWVWDTLQAENPATFAPGDIEFGWDSIPSATYYEITILELETIVGTGRSNRLSEISDSTESTSWTWAAIPNSPEAHYSFQIAGFNESGVQVGRSLVRFDNNWVRGWDFNVSQ